MSVNINSSDRQRARNRQTDDHVDTATAPTVHLSRTNSSVNAKTQAREPSLPQRGGGGGGGREREGGGGEVSGEDVWSALVLWGGERKGVREKRSLGLVGGEMPVKLVVRKTCTAETGGRTGSSEDS